MLNWGKAQRRIATFSIQHSAFSILFIFALFFVMPLKALATNDNFDIFFHPYTV